MKLVDTSKLIEDTKKWDLSLLLFGLFVPTFLLLTWYFPLTRMLWDFIDTKIFFFLNSFIATNTISQHFWAFNNHRAMDWIHDGVMITFFCYFIKSAPKDKRTKAVAIFLFCILIMYVTITFVNKGIITNFFHFKRLSPSIIFDNAALLSEKVSFITVKDRSKSSFPGDHGTTAILFAIYTRYFMGNKLGFFASLYAIFFCLPRLICGAHFATDIIMGSFVIAIITSSIVLGTPIQYYLLTGFNKCLRAIKFSQKIKA